MCDKLDEVLFLQLRHKFTQLCWNLRLEEREKDKQSDFIFMLFEIPSVDKWATSVFYFIKFNLPNKIML